MNIVLWILQFLLALHTLMGALWKFGNSEQTVGSLQSIPHGVWLGISVLEIIFAVCLVLPAFQRRRAILAPLGAIGIGAVMVLYCGLHLASGDPDKSPMIYWLVVAAVCAVIAVSRMFWKPIK